MPDIEPLDKICNTLFIYIVSKDEKMGFNKLHNSLEKDGYKISTPTLSRHLKHLTKRKFLKRRKIGKQKVSYEINWKKSKELTKARKSGKTIENRITTYKTFKSSPIENQLALVEFALSYTILQQLQLSILSILNPKNTFEHHLTLTFISEYLNIFKFWLIKECKDNNELGKQALQIINSRINAYWKLITKYNI